MRPVKIALDPGHGGRDPGAIGARGVKEADVNLMIAEQLSSLLVDKYDVMITRPADVFVALPVRAESANSWGADIFISIHCNAASNPRARGIEVFHYLNSQKGQQLADCIYAGLEFVTGQKGRGVREANFVVLRHTKMPACLVECGFVSNLEEEKLLATPSYRALLAKGIVVGLEVYLDTKGG